MMVNVAQLAHITMIGLGYALIQKQMIEQTLQIMSINVTVGRVGRTIHAKRRFEKLDTGYAERQNPISGGTSRTTKQGY